ncbi:Hypothetical predicted protein, partial [Olea europaea subsp. europaea]
QLDKHMKMVCPQVSEVQLDHLRDEYFSCWLREYEKYELSMELEHGLELLSQPDINIELWCEATQGPSKGGHLYGLGTSLSASSTSSRSKFIPSMEYDDGDVSLKQQLHNACEKIDELTKERDDIHREIEEVRWERIEFEKQMEEKRHEG